MWVRTSRDLGFGCSPDAFGKTSFRADLSSPTYRSSDSPGDVESCLLASYREDSCAPFLTSEKSLMSVIFPLAILGPEWLRQFDGRLGIFLLSAGKPPSL